jgi:hypothetical protein
MNSVQVSFLCYPDNNACSVAVTAIHAHCSHNRSCFIFATFCPFSHNNKDHNFLITLLNLEISKLSPYFCFLNFKTAKSQMAKRRIQSRVCLNMIAKDEANDRLIPTLQAAAIHITGYVFCDTGSTDGTPELAKSIFDYFNLEGKIVHHTWKDFAHNRNYCITEGKRLLGNQCDYWLLLDADQFMVNEESYGLAELELKDSAYFLREVARDSEFTNRRVISTTFPWKYFGKVHEVILPADETFAGKDTTGTLPRSIYSIHESDMGRGFERDAILLESSVQEDPSDKRATFYLANTYNMLNRKEDAIVWWAKRTMMGGWEEERYMSAFWIASVFDVYLRGKSIAPATWDQLVAAGLVTERPERDPEAQVDVSIHDLIAILKIGHTYVPTRQEVLYYIAKFSRADLQDYDSCVDYAIQARSKGPYNETTLFASVNVYKYGVLDELCVCSYYVPEKADTVGQKACKDLITLLVSEGVTETQGRDDLIQMLKLTRQNLKAHELLALNRQRNLEMAANGGKNGDGNGVEDSNS